MKKIDTNEVLFYYNPNIGEFTVYAGAKFICDGTQFKVDLNPHGESKLKEVTDLQYNSTQNTLSYLIDKKDAYLLATKSNVCSIAFKTIFASKLNFDNSHDLDKIDLFIENDVLNHMYLNKSKDYVLLDAVRIIKEEENYYLIKNKPKYIKEKIKKILLLDKSLEITTDNNVHYYEFNISPTILSLLVEIFSILELTKAGS